MRCKAAAQGGSLPLLLVVAALMLASCGAGGGQEGNGKASGGDTEAGQTRPAERVTVNELTSDPSEYYGDTVTVSGEVIDAVEPGVFRIEKDNARLLVVGVQQIPKIVTGDTKAVNKGDLIKVTGEVRQFKKEEIRNRVDRGIDDEYFGDYGGDPAVLAYSVEVIS